MKRFDTEKARAILQRRLNKAVAKSEAIAARYVAITGNIYLDPRFEDSSKAVLTELPTSEFDFVTRHERRVLFRKTFDNGYGYREYRTISKRTFAHLDRLEVELLNAWEKERDIAWELRRLNDACPTLFTITAA